MKITRVSPSHLHELLKYNSKTGKLTWRKRPRRLFTTKGYWKAWNKRYAGKLALDAPDSYGYRVGRIYGKVYKSHIVIWAMTEGKWPENEIEHRDGLTGNNRKKNLRDVTHAENMANPITKERLRRRSGL